MTVPLAVVATYLVAVTLAGSLVVRRGQSAREWTVAGGSLTTLMLVVGLAGTRIGGAGTYGVAGDVITGGVWYLLWYSVATFLALAVTGLFFARTYRKLQLQTVGELFWLRFGSRRAQVLTSLCVQTLYLAVNIIEPYVIGTILVSLTGMPVALGVAIGGLVLITYTALGGLRGAAVANLVHSVVIVAGLTLVAALGVHHLGGWTAMRAAADAQLAAAAVDSARWWSLTGGGWAAIAGMIFAAVIHTPAASIYANFATAARSPRLLVPGFVLGGLVAGVMPICAGLIGIQALARYGVASGPRGYASVTAMALEISPWLGGLALAAVLAAVVSSGGPVLLSSATMFVRDWLPQSRGWTAGRQLQAYRLTTVIYGTGAAVLAWAAAVRGISLLQLLLIGYAMVVPPAIAVAYTLFWPRTTESGAFWGMLLGYAAGVVWYLGWYASTGLDPSHPATLVPLVAVPAISLLTPPQAMPAGVRASLERADD
jgi:Na+/proline symporter